MAELPRENQQTAKAGKYSPSLERVLFNFFFNFENNK